MPQQKLKSLSPKMQSSLLRAREAIYILLILSATILLDQVTKTWAKGALRSREAIEFANGMFRLEYAENPGAFLGLGGGLSANARFWIFTVLVAGFLIFAAVSLFRMQSDRTQQIGLALLVGGGLGNLWDRLLYQRVVDFMNLGLGDLRTGIFNFADFAIVIGICLMLFGQYLTGKAIKVQKLS